jgi:multicomponent Na+:H+ antiporter subunit G
MILEWIRFAIAAVLAILGLCSFGSAVLGAYRFGFVLNRMHAAGIGDTAGIFLMIASLAVARGLQMDTLKLVVLVFFLWFTSPVSTHFLGQVEYYTNPLLGRHVKKAEIPKPEGQPEQENLTEQIVEKEKMKGDGDAAD